MLIFASICVHSRFFLGLVSICVHSRFFLGLVQLDVFFYGPAVDPGPAGDFFIIPVLLVQAAFGIGSHQANIIKLYN